MRHDQSNGGLRLDDSQKRRPKRIPSFAALRRHWREDLKANRRDLFKPGFQAVAVYRFGVWVDGLEPWLLRAPLFRFYRLLFQFARNFYGIELSHKVRVGRRLRIGHQHGIVVHQNVSLGDDCLIRQNVTIGVAHDLTPTEEVPMLGDRVELGAGAVVLSPARIGDDVRIGPNVVVRGVVPSCSVVLPAEPTIRARGGAGGGVRARPAAVLRSGHPS